jgi:NAD(P)H dehydrogenase (quinone)
MERRKGMKLQVIFYSMYGHTYRMAEAIAEGARSLAQAEVEIYQVRELIPDDVLESSGAKKAREEFAHVPLASVDKLEEADAIIFGSPTRFGMICAQMRNFLDQTGGVWARGGLVGKVGSVFTSTGTQHGGQETTLIGFIITLLHHGMIIVGVPYTETHQLYVAGISGGSPYGASTISGPDRSLQPNDNELEIARFQGRRVAETARILVEGRKQ